MFERMERFDIWKALSIIFQEGLSREKQLCINTVVLDLDKSDILRLNLQCTMSVDLHWHLRLLFLGVLKILLPHVPDSCITVKDLALKLLHVIFVIEFSVDLHKLIRHRQEHHAPGLHRIVVVLLDDAPGNFKVIVLAAEEIKVCLQVIVLNAKCAHRLFGFFYLAEKVNRFMHSVLQLQVVN